MANAYVIGVWMAKKVKITFTISPGLRDRVVALAESDGRSLSGWICRTLERVAGQGEDARRRSGSEAA